MSSRVDSATRIARDGGVVVSRWVSCTSDGDCVTGEICDMDQGDCNTNGIGDACEKYADANGDGKVDLSDLVIMKGEFLQPCPPSPCSSDCNGDGKIDLNDLVIMKEQFLQ